LEIPALDERRTYAHLAAMTRLTIRIDLDQANSFGPGKAKLLELVEEYGSIRKAAAGMEMSYRQAWLLIRAISDAFGAPVVETATGGAQGGGARLTPLGQQVLSRYRALEKQAGKVLGADIEALAKLAKSRGKKASA
jgi:molybdate transport system regulatory protein